MTVVKLCETQYDHQENAKVVIIQLLFLLN